MIDIKDILEESKYFSPNKKHVFRDANFKFKDLKNLFNAAFGAHLVKFSKKVPKFDVYFTTTDGKWFISSYDRPKEKYPLGNAFKLRESDESDAAFKSTIDDIAEAFQQIDGKLLNRFFANGKNNLHMTIIFPPANQRNKCFLKFNGIDCFDGNKNIGKDEKSSFELYKILKSCPCLAKEFSSLDPEQLAILKKCPNEKNTLSNIMKKLTSFANELGWGSTIQEYICDRYSKYLTNKAMKHNIDVSKNSQFINELAGRLSGTSVTHPTRSDLMTFAKRDGINVKSQEYRDFLADVEDHAAETNAAILSPLENTMRYGLANALKCLISYIAFDSNDNTKKIVKMLHPCLCGDCSSIENCNNENMPVDVLKNDIKKLCSCIDDVPSEILIMNNGIPYTMSCNIAKIRELMETI